MKVEEALLTRMIRIYGFEHKAVIQFSELLERGNVPLVILESIVDCHEKHPIPA